MTEVHPHIAETIRQDGATTRLSQYLRCTHHGCRKQMDLTVKGKRKPADVISKMAKNKGWLPDMEKGLHLCPAHNPEKKIEEKMPTKTKDIPVEMTPKLRRAIFREIDGSYDEKSQRYVPGESDETVASRCNTTWGKVAIVREENFGPAGPSKEMAEIMDEIANLSTQVLAAETEALAAAEKAENLGKAIVQLKARVECLT